MERKITLIRLVILSLFLFVIQPATYAQVYQHNFGDDAISTHPYTVAPTVINPYLSGSSWSNSTGAWTSLGGATGQAISLANSSGTPTITLTFNVASGKQLDVTSFSFWRQRSSSGAQNWSLTINGIAVGFGTVPPAGTTTGTIPVALSVTGLTGTVTAVLSLSGASGTGTFRLDDFTLNGSVTSNCVAPVITSVYPASGPANTLVTITGTGFTNGSGTSAVNFNGTASTGFTVVSDTQIKAIVPANATTGVVTVITNSCEGTATNFTVLQSDCPTGVTPTDIFISELFDQNGGTPGAIELYNPTSSTITFNGQYVLERWGTIGDPSTLSPGYTLILTGSIAPNSTYLLSSGDIPCGITPVGGFGGGINASDEFFLKKNGVVIDDVWAPGEIGYTVIRNPDSVLPSATYNAADWTVSSNESCANLGIHTINLTASTHITAQPLSAAICEGEAVTYTVTIDNATGITYQWKMLNAAGTWVNITNNDVFSGATTGALTITDAPLDLNGAQFYCQVLTTASCNLISNAVQLTVSPLPVAIVTTVQPTCVTSTGSIVIVPSIGDGLTYSLNGTTYQTSPLFSNLAPGTYTLYVKSSANCVAQIPFTINAVPTLPAVANVTVTQPGCGQTTGSITINSPLDATLTYSINGIDFQAGTVFNNLAPGTYTVTVLTALGCASVSANITINPAPATPAVATYTVTQPTCAVPTGTITVTAPTGAGYNYSINGGTTWQTGTLFTGVIPGTYTITTQNAGGCTSVTGTITINTPPGAPAPATVTVTQPTCSVSTGTIAVTAPTGAGFSYSINGGTTWQTGTTFGSLPAGSYVVTTQNTAGCTSATATITINAAPTTPAVATYTVTQPTCAAPTGTISVSAPTGAGYNYSIDGGTTWQTGTVFTGLAQGTYTITTQSSGGCTSVTGSITINTAPVSAPPTTVTVTQPTCTASTGSIFVTAPMGTGYSYSIDGGTTWQTGATFGSLPAGNYVVTTQNASGCTSSTANITINTAPTTPGTPTYTVTQPTCTTPSGTITITAPTGTGITYSIDGGTTWQASTVFSGLVAGTYDIIAQNAAGCTSTVLNIIIDAAPAAPATPIVTVQQPNCTTITKGNITVTSPTGTGYTYSIDGTTWQAGTTFSDVNGGTYTVSVQNVSGCIATTTVTINAGGTPPAVADTTVTNPTCTVNTGSITVTAPLGAEYTYSIDGGTTWQAGVTFASLAPGAYQVMVTNTGGCTSTTPQITIAPSPVPAQATTIITQPTCFDAQGSVTITAPTGSGFTYSIDGVNFQNGTQFINLDPGNYTITVQNLAGCQSVTSITINAAPVTPAVPTTTLTQPTCDNGGGVITVTAPVGTGYTYSIDGGTTWQSAASFSGLAAGSYTVTVMSSGGCIAQGTPNVINDATGTFAVAGSEGCEEMTGGSRHYMLHVMPVNGSFDENNVTYSWIDENGVVVSTEGSFDVTEYADNAQVDPSEYPLQFVVVITTPGGCTGTTAFIVQGTFCDIPKGISPNNDGKNDNFDISGMNARKVTIYNRFGKEIYSRSNYTNEWYGQTDSGDAPSGTYYYVVELPTETRTGWVYINREID